MLSLSTNLKLFVATSNEPTKRRCERKRSRFSEINHQRYLVKARVDRSGSAAAARARKVPAKIVNVHNSLEITGLRDRVVTPCIYLQLFAGSRTDPVNKITKELQNVLIFPLSLSLPIIFITARLIDHNRNDEETDIFYLARTTRGCRASGFRRCSINGVKRIKKREYNIFYIFAIGRT